MKFSQKQKLIWNISLNYLSYPKARGEQVKKLKIQIAFILLPFGSLGEEKCPSVTSRCKQYARKYPI